MSIKKGTPETPYNVFYEIEVTEYKISQKLPTNPEKITDYSPSIENTSINGSPMVEMPSETLDFNSATETEPEAESDLENFVQNLHFTPPSSPPQESSRVRPNPQIPDSLPNPEIPDSLPNPPPISLPSSDLTAEDPSPFTPLTPSA